MLVSVSLRSLKFFNHPEGYVEPSFQTERDGSQTLIGTKYIYQYKDHLGNIRLAYSDSDGNGTIAAPSEIIEENNYYPFGLKHKGYNNVINGTDHPYGFIGMKENDEIGLGWHDFGARNYDASIGRWFNPDPLAELDYGITPFRYGYNNPMLFIDPNGLWEFKVNGNEEDGYYVTLVAEEGDNLESLAEATGFSVEELSEMYDEDTIQALKDGEIESLSSFGGYIEGMNEALNMKKVDGCNCFGSSIDFGLDKKVNPKGEIGNSFSADRKLRKKYKETNKPKTGDVIRYAKEDGYLSIDLNGDGTIDDKDKFILDLNNLPRSGIKIGGTSHYANFLLKNKAGETLIFSKNGNAAKWQIMLQESIKSDYGNPTGIKGGSSVYTPKQ